MKTCSRIFQVLGLLLCLSFETQAQNDPLPVRNDTAINISSRIMPENRTVWIHLPADYYTTDNTYPVLYLLDGDSHFDYGARMADFLAGHDRNRIPEMIVVGIVNVDRQRDFSPDAGRSRFSRYLEEEVVAYVDAHYRVQPYRILAAHSLAGLVALSTKETKPALFSATILTSPVTNPELLQHIGACFSGSHPHNGQMFVGIGNENTAAVDALLKELKQHAPAWFKYAHANYPGENHFTVPYKTLFDGLKFIYRDWFIDFYGKQVLTQPGLVKHFEKLSADFGYTITPTEDFLNSCGYYELGFKRSGNAIAIFAENARRHPGSANAYDSLGEAFMAAGNKPDAIRNYKRSLELNPHNDNGKQMLEKLEHIKP
ncbi:alpha/beta hydrolase-fold protein [Mucilaginibacter sp. Mucisp84]|uniref:alpha/beta hydrolase-fold protein n=1 Tax=Mucilaginibacter sp. Mucisp84 TaxID=3243058 RepID=UPI0039A61655